MKIKDLICLVTTEFITIIIIYGGTLQPLKTCTKNMNYLSPTFQSYCSKSYSIQMNEFLFHYIKASINIFCIQERGGEKSSHCDSKLEFCAKSIHNPFNSQP